MWKTLLGIGGGLVGGATNAFWTNEINDRNAERNQHYWNLQNQQTWHQSEVSADRAMQRQYQLYNDLQSPQALAEQYKKAGLNPALLYGMGGGGGNVTSAPQAQAGSGSGAPTLGTQNIIDPLTMAQIANINADTKNKEQQNDNIKADTALKKAQELLNLQTHDQNAKKFATELAIMIATQAIQENEVNSIPTNNAIKQKQLEILENEAQIKAIELEFQKRFKEKGLDLGSMDGMTSAIIQLGDKFINWIKSKWGDFFNGWPKDLSWW